MAAAFFVVARECDNDWRFLFRLSGHDIVAELAAEAARSSARPVQVFIDLSNE